MRIPFIDRAGAGHSLTLLFVTQRRLVRADFVGRSDWQMRAFWDAPAPSGESLAVRAELALRLGPRGRSAVYLLATGISTQVMELGVGTVTGLDGAGLVRALGFEAETVSGIDPFDSMLAWCPSGGTAGQRGYWVTQLSGMDLEEIRRMLAAQGGLLCGVAHPGGLPRMLGDAVGGWQRIELWEDVVVGVDGSAPVLPRTQVWPTPPSRGAWTAQAEQWFGGRSSSRTVLAGEFGQLQHASGLTSSLDEEAVLKAWLREWVMELSGDRPRAPVVRPVRKPVSEASLRRLGGVLAVGAVGLCVAHFVLLQGRERLLRRELVEAEAAATELAGFKAKADGLQGRLDQARRESVQLGELREYWKDTLDREHRRHAALLDVLARATPEGLVIVHIDEIPGELRVTGLSSGSDIPGFATNVAGVMDRFGWRVDPPRRRALEWDEEGGPWQLEWTLKVLAPTPGMVMGGGTNRVGGLSKDAIRTAAEVAGALGR